jgi:hypothetical protein
VLVQLSVFAISDVMLAESRKLGAFDTEWIILEFLKWRHETH